MIPRIGETVQTGRHYTFRPGAYCILPKGRSVLLTVQVDDNWDLQLPGGGIDPGENPIGALHREVLEETGWRIAAPRRLGAFRRFVFMPEYDLWAEKLCTVYVARPVRKLHNPIERNHLARWTPMEEAAAKLGNPGDQLMMRLYLGV